MIFADVLNWIVFAQDKAPAAPQQPGMESILLPIGLIVMMYFFLLHRPQKREQALRQDMLKNLKKNDRVLTNSGIFGVVTNITPEKNEVTIRVDETSNTKLRMSLSAIARVLEDDAADDKKEST